MLKSLLKVNILKKNPQCFKALNLFVGDFHVIMRAAA